MHSYVLGFILGLFRVQTLNPSTLGFDLGDGGVYHRGGAGVHNPPNWGVRGQGTDTSIRTI